MNAFTTETGLEDLPRVIPIFPLEGALLLPHGRLPLNIFEPRYLAMVRDAMAGPRIIGMVQPKKACQPDGHIPVYDVGCAGKIVEFSETPDGRFLISLEGISRFRMREELDCDTPYRQIMPAYEEFDGDVAESPSADTPLADTDPLLNALRQYLDLRDIPADWHAIERMPGPTLVTTLAMICPFRPSEKQALLEAPSYEDRTQIMTMLMEMALTHGGAGYRVQ